MLFSFLLFAAAASAHITMLSPEPFGNPDSSPLSPSGSDFPCKGKLPEYASGPVTEWAAGSSQTFKLSTGAAHGGGSCQASISEDGGKTFKVIKTFIGGCPQDQGGEFDFVVPKEAKSGEAIFAWTWFNKIGNREMYMNCAAINISGGGSGLGGEEFPDIFTANIGGDCKSNAEGSQAVLEIPNPGPNTERNGEATEPPQGSCAAGAAARPGGSAESGAESGSGSGTGSGSESGSGAGSGTGESGSGSGTGSGAGAQPTQTFDDGLYHPPSATAAAPTTAVATSEAAVPTSEAAVPTSEAAVPTSEAAVPTSAAGESSAAAAPSPTGAAEPEGQVYDIVMVINGKTETGKATLSLPTAAPKNKRRMVFRA